MKTRTLIIIATIFFALSWSPVLFSQQLDVAGKAKISEMDTDNTSTDLVVRQEDGTLAKRKVQTLPQLNAGVQDSTRTFESDFKMAELLCNCQYPSPFLIESALNNGYSIEDMVKSGAGARSLYEAGANLDSLLEYGYTAGELMEVGANPMDLYDLGIPLKDLYGNLHAGGYLFFLDIDNDHPFDGLIISYVDQSTNAPWGCDGGAVPGADDFSIGAGKQNTQDILAGCLEQDIAADLCDEYEGTLYNSTKASDYFLPSLDELEEMYNNLKVEGDGNIGDFIFWSSTEWITGYAYVFDMVNGNTAVVEKDDATIHTRAVRSFGD